jgi:hypothetical protein
LASDDGGVFLHCGFLSSHNIVILQKTIMNNNNIAKTVMFTINSKSHSSDSCVSFGTKSQNIVYDKQQCTFKTRICEVPKYSFTPAKFETLSQAKYDYRKYSIQ